MAKSLGYDQLLQLAVAEGATSPNPGITGVLAYSTTLGRPVHWTGTQWTAGSAGGGSGDVVGPASSTSGTLAVFNGTTGKIIKSVPVIGIEISSTIGALVSPDALILGTSNGATGSMSISAFGTFEINNQAGIAGQFLKSNGTGNATTWGTAGDVVGPASSTDGHLLVSSGTTGKVLREATWFDTQATVIPAAPAAGDLRWFGRSRAGRTLPHIIGPSGIDVALQPSLFGNSIYMWLPGTGTTASINFGTNWAARNSGTAAAQAHPTKTSTNALTSLNRATFGTGTTSTGTSGTQSGASVAWRGNASGLGGFFYFSRFAVETYRADLQIQVGLSARNAALSADPSLDNNSIALVKDAADTNWFLCTRNGTTTTKTATGLAIAAGTILDLIMFAPPNGSNVTVRLVNAVDGTVYMDDVVITSTLPVNTTFLFAHAAVRSTIGTTAALLALNRIYVETDL